MSKKHEMCSSHDVRFFCAHIADVWRFASALPDQTNAAVPRRQDRDRRRLLQSSPEEDDNRAEVKVTACGTRASLPVWPGRFVSYLRRKWSSMTSKLRAQRFDFRRFLTANSVGGPKYWNGGVHYVWPFKLGLRIAQIIAFVIGAHIPPRLNKAVKEQR
jgi:hypothetical protein